MSGEADGGPAGPWRWDPTLYAGAAPHYARGRAPYPPKVAATLVDALGLDGSQGLLDIGCGPGSLTLLLAPHVAEAVGVDADPGMIVEAARIAEQVGIANVQWRQLRAEQLPADLDAPDVITFAQSFHWMDRPRVAAIARALLRPGGAVVHVGAHTHAGVEPDGTPAHPVPPRNAIDRLVREYLGPVRRAGQGVLPTGTVGGQDRIFRSAGFGAIRKLVVPAWSVVRTTEEVVSSVYSLSSAAPHLFGDRLSEFDGRLRAVLADVSPDGRFTERLPPIALDIWR